MATHLGNIIREFAQGLLISCLNVQFSQVEMIIAYTRTYENKRDRSRNNAKKKKREQNKETKRD